MTKAEATTKVLAIIGPFAKNAEALKTAGPETKILSDLGVNSARLVDIILAFEDEFNIAIDDDTADKIRTIGDAVDQIVALTGA
ncbi:MAG: acyl carrier protein [Spirochaetes bacterium GWB1_48_6]|nr:MAG: acyl carrier protein [Spirochaetes bacterium GWB1_48_6]